MNLQEPKVYKTIEAPDGLGDTKEKRVVDIDATRVVQRKADDIRKAFKAWIFKDSVRREAIVERYNELFNSIRPREFDGSALSFPDDDGRYKAPRSSEKCYRTRYVRWEHLVCSLCRRRKNL